MQNSDGLVRVLIVDDEKNIRDASERILSRIGFEVCQASRGDEALALLSKEDVAIVLLDLKMPGMDGMEVLEQIRKINPSILVIVITGFATVQTAIEAMKQGAYDFIPKPFEPDQLRIVVRRAQEKVRLIREAEKLENEKRRTLLDLDTEKSRIHTILESLPNGVVVTNSQGHVVLMNPAFVRLLELSSDKRPGDRIDAYVTDEGLCKLIMEISEGKHIDFEDIPTYGFALGDDKYLLAKGRPVLGERHECLGAVVTVMDITALKVLDRLKSEFVAKVSHELRSPLSTIHEQLALVMRDKLDSTVENERLMLARAQEKTRGLIDLISDLLDLSRIESGTICQEQKPVGVPEVLKNIQTFMQTKAQGKKQTLNLKLPAAPLPMIVADPIALESIFGNLIANAITYTPEGGKISITADFCGINIIVKVADNGFGIEARHLDKIFEKFYRVKDEKTRYITGTGLGLPIVKELVESLGGMIEVESTPGQGSVFTVILPVAAP